MTLLALFHILMAIPALYFLSKTNFRNLSLSSWCLLIFTIMLVLSVVFNQDITEKGYSAISKTKYFFFGFLSIAPISWWMKKYSNDKKISILLYTFCVVTTVATLSGLCGTWFGVNPILFKTVEIGGRYGGLFGMVMNYAHNMAYFLIIIFGLLIYKNDSKKYINTKFLTAVFIINLIGFYYCYTRGAWLAFLLGAPFYFFKDNKKLFGVGVLLIITLGSWAYFSAGKNVIRSSSDTQRISQWKAAAEAFKERPVLGYGYLNFEPHSAEIKRRYNFGELTLSSHAHNNFLEIAADAGILGLFFYLAWILFWIKETYKGQSLASKIGFPFILVFIVGGLTQATISLGINLFFILAAYAITQVSDRVLKS